MAMIRALQLLADRQVALVDRDAPPAPGPDEVQLRVRAVGLNHIDVWGFRGMAFAKRLYPADCRRRGLLRGCRRRRQRDQRHAGRPRSPVLRPDLRHLPRLPSAAATICARMSPACAASISTVSPRT